MLPEWIKSALESITNIFTWVSEKLWNKLVWVKDRMVEEVAWLANTIWNKLIWVKDRLVEGTAWLGNTIWDKLKEFKGLVDVSIDAVGKSLTTAFDGAVSTFTEWVRQVLTGITEALGSGLQGFFQWLITGARWIAEEVWGLATGFATWLKDMVIDFFTDIINRLREALMPGSPPQPLTEAMMGLAEEFQQSILKDIEGIYSSPAAEEAIVGTVIKTAGKAITLSTTGEVMGATADSAHPTKSLHVRDVIKSIFSYFGIERLIKTPLSIPYEIALLRPFTQIMEAKFTTNIPGIAEATRFLWRGKITEEEFKDVVKRHGYNENYADAFLELTKVIPSITDLVRFTVREAWGDHTFEEQMPAFYKWSAAQGLDKVFADAYWWSHWIIPTYEQAREMFWRGKIDEEEFHAMIRRADYAPEYSKYWDELSWRLPGRIAIRWMYEWGLIEKDDMLRLLRAEGMHPDWQERVADAYLKNQLRDEIGRARTALISLFAKGKITDIEELRTKLTELGIRKESVDFNIKEAEYRKLLSEKEEKIEVKKNVLTDEHTKVRTALVKLFRIGKLPRDKLEAELRGMGYTSEEIEATIKYADLLIEYDKATAKEETVKDILKDERTKTRTILVRLFKEGFLSSEELGANLTGIGYSPEEVDASLKYAKLEFDLELKRDQADIIMRSFRSGLITESEARRKLGELGLRSEKTEALINYEKARKKVDVEAVRLLTASQLLKAFKSKIITEEEARKRLESMNYPERDRDILIAMHLPEAE